MCILVVMRRSCVYLLIFLFDILHAITELNRACHCSL